MRAMERELPMKKIPSMRGIIFSFSALSAMVAVGGGKMKNKKWFECQICNGNGYIRRIEDRGSREISCPDCDGRKGWYITITEDLDWRDYNERMGKY